MLGEACSLFVRDALLLIIGYRSVGVERLLQVKIVYHAGGCQKARPARFALAQRTRCYLPHTPMSTKPDVISKAPTKRTATPCSL
jgi:hypothetical protein